MRITNTDNIIITLIIIGILAIGTAVGTDAYMEQKEVIKQENQCIAELIELGIKRKEIITDNGDCYVRN